MSTSLRVLMVCTGNICRSPTAEGVLRKMLGEAGLHRQVEVDSAGTVDYHAGSPPDARAQAHAVKRGYDLSRLRARKVVPADFERFDLLLAMDVDHLEYLRERCPPERVNRIGMLMSFAPKRPAGTEVPDPYYGAPAGFEQVLDLVEEACEGLLRHLQERLADGS
jgi:protein-tyrosine phosphatase